VAAAATVAALRDGLPWMHEHITLAKRNRDALVAELRAHQLEVTESAANFVFVPIANAAEMARRMRELGLAVRAFSGLTPVSRALSSTNGDALRISVGPWNEMEAVLDALDRTLAS
jgi:histidinol-phosphate/aromatic aminotransferase/cobyric acid decarboxylase-like protein